MTDTDVKHHIVCTVVLVAVAIDAMSLLLGTNLAGVEDIALREILQAALSDSQMFKAHISGSQGTIREIRVYAVRTDLYAERLVAAPLILLLAIDIHRHLLPFGSEEKLLPLVLWNNNLVALAIVIFRIASLEVSHHLVCLLHHEVQRRNINRYSYIGIVRIDVRLFRFLLIILWQRRMAVASDQQQHN